MDSLGTIILAGHNEGRENLLREYLEKKVYSFLYSTFSDSFIFGKNKALLPALPEEPEITKMSIADLCRDFYNELRLVKNGSLASVVDGEPENARKTVVSHVVDAVNGSPYIDSRYTITVGPKIRLERALDGTSNTVQQGRSLAENSALGSQHLFKDLGYQGDYFLVICGDLSALQPSTITGFIESVSRRNDDQTTLYVGVSSWHALKDLIEQHGLTHYGKMGSRFFPFIPGRINKFGLTVIDDDRVGDEPGALKRYSWANMFIVHKDLADRPEMTDYLYNHKRVFLDPGMAYSLYDTAGFQKLWRLLVKNTLTVTEAEDVVSTMIRKRFRDMPHFKTKIAEAPPEALLDIDTIMDYRRNAALIQRRAEGQYCAK
jgi:hypothetical protein